jgi:CheY-like chemotaxis protein
MSGDILVTSIPGAGSTFKAVVGLKRACESAEETAVPAAILPAPAMHHVLLALDGPMERRALRLSLEGAGIPSEEGTIEQAPVLVTAAEAAGEPFTTLLVDGRCGCGTAAQLLRRAREAAGSRAVQGIVVLYTTAKPHFAEFREAGFDAYLVRPVRPQSVLTLVGARRGRSTEPPEMAKSGRLLSARLGTPRVLLVEDNDINALLARRMLEKTGCQASLSLNGREAVEAVKRVLYGVDPPYDLVLMDIHMPVLDGLEATRLISELFASQPDGAFRRPPIVALTANAFDEDRRRCLAAGMDDYLAKPFDREDLLRMLERWCGESEGTRAA